MTYIFNFHIDQVTDNPWGGRYSSTFFITRCSSRNVGRLALKKHTRGGAV